MNDFNTELMCGKAQEIIDLLKERDEYLKSYRERLIDKGKFMIELLPKDVREYKTAHYAIPTGTTKSPKYILELMTGLKNEQWSVEYGLSEDTLRRLIDTDFRELRLKIKDFRENEKLKVIQELVGD